MEVSIFRNGEIHHSACSMHGVGSPKAALLRGYAAAISLPGLTRNHIWSAECME